MNLLLALVALAAVLVIVVLIVQNLSNFQSDPPADPTGTLAVSQSPALSPSPVVTPSAKPTPSIEPSSSPSTTPVPTPEIKYELYTENVSWQGAKQRAEELGGHLVTIADSEEFAQVVAMLEGTRARYIWLGAQRGADGSWTWENGESVEFFKWYPGEPSYRDTDGTPENCMMIWRGASGASPEWTYNDMRGDPYSAYPAIFGGYTAFIVEYE